MKFKTLMMTVVAGALMATQALAWGGAGHRMIGEEGVRALPDYMPAFLRTPKSIADVGEYSREPDRWRGAGKTSDSDLTPAHFIDLDDDGKTLGGQTLDQLPATRSDFEAALRAQGIDPFKSGYLPYSTVIAYQEVAKDMATWRVLSLMETRETDKLKKAWYHADRLRREQLLLRDIGVLSHYVGDSTQPLHTSIHYNGWGDYPNPDGYSKDPVHAPFEGAFVMHNVTNADIRAAMPAYTPCTERTDLCFDAHMKQSQEQVVPLYKLIKAGDLVDGNADMKAFAVHQLGLGAADLRDALLDAWRDSKTVKVGYPAWTYDDFVGGKVENPWTSLNGSD